jgi:hypothetical protein
MRLNSTNLIPTTFLAFCYSPNIPQWRIGYCVTILVQLLRCVLVSISCLYWFINRSAQQLPRCPLLPGELWQDIIGYLSKSDLKALATAHRLIRFHAIPLLYRKVTISTVQPTAYEQAKGLVETPYILKWISTLIFLAPFEHLFTRNMDIFNNFVPYFTKMPNLRELKLTCIHLSSRAEMKILETPLISFTCDQCWFSGQLASAVACQSSVTNLQLSVRDADFSHSPPTFLNNFANVKTLDLTLPHREYTHFPSFPSLTSLAIQSVIGLSTFCLILRQSPHLARLRCIQRSFKDNEGTPIKPPRLQHIEAPFPVVIESLESPLLMSIVILAMRGFGDNHCSAIDRLLVAIKRGPTQQMTSLDMTVLFQNQEQARELLEKLSDAVPNLSRFTLRVDPFGFQTQVASPLYNGSARLPKLESLTVSIALIGKEQSQQQVIPEDIVEPFARAFLEPLVQPICPSLQVVRIFPWYRDSLSWTVLEGEGTTWRFERRD